MNKLFFILIPFALFWCCGEELRVQEIPDQANSSNENIHAMEKDFPVLAALPPGWEFSYFTEMGMMHVLSPTDSLDNFREMVNIVVGGTRGNDLDSFFDGNLKMLQVIFEELNQTEKPDYQTINGVEFKKVRYNYLVDGLPLTAQLFVTIQDSTSFIINCSALQNTFDTYAQDFEKIVNSVVIK